jgi:ABC-type branched-chain amino acid transport systems, periplasmic component
MRKSTLFRPPVVLAAAFAIGAVLATSWPAAHAQQAPGGELKIGALLPMTGPAAQFGPSMSAAVELAARDINAAGGVLGRKITLVQADEAGDANIASQALDRLLSQDVKAVMGTGSTSVTLSLLDKLVRARASICSGANTGPQLSAYPHQGYFARTSYSAVLQGPVFSQLAIEDGHSRIAILARGDSFGKGMAEAAEQSFKAAGGEVLATVIYDPAQTSFDSEVQRIAGMRPGGVVLIGYDERGKILRSMVERGIGPAKVGVYTTGVLSPEFWKSVNPADASVLEKVKQTASPLLAKGNDFGVRLAAHKAGLATTQFAPEQYDCLVITALAMSAAKSTDANVYKAQVPQVTRGAVECSTYRDCLRVLGTGKTIAYVGPTGPTRLSDNGDPTTARFQIYAVDAKGVSQPVRQLQVKAP